MTQDRTDVYARVTSAIVAAIEAGAGRYRFPWHHDGAATSRPANVVSRRPYRGGNTLALWAAAYGAGYGSSLWGTYRQWAELGAQVRRGECATCIVFWKTSRTAATEGEGDGEAKQGRRRLFARGYSVFNEQQVDGYAPPQTPRLPETERLAQADAFYGNLGIATEYGGDDALYRPSTDTVVVPRFAQFHDLAGFYDTLFHEAAHATAAPHRCDRDLSGRFGSDAYAMEELVAQIGAAFVLADLGIEAKPRPDHAAYIASWLRALRNDTTAVFTAASKAQAAADWMHAQQPEGMRVALSALPAGLPGGGDAADEAGEGADLREAA